MNEHSEKNTSAIQSGYHCAAGFLPQWDITSCVAGVLLNTRALVVNEKKKKKVRVQLPYRLFAVCIRMTQIIELPPE